MDRRSLHVFRAYTALRYFSRSEVPAVERYLANVLPMTIMAALVIYCIKDISITASGTCIPYLIGIVATTLIHPWNHNNHLSIALGTAAYMVIA